MDAVQKLLLTRGRLARRLPRFREMLPGSFIERRLRCGKPTCACRLREQKHTAYQLTYRLAGKTVSRMIPRDQAEDVRGRVQLQREFAEHVRRIQEINLQLLLMRLGKRG